MGSGSLYQLVSKGASDISIIGTPQITLFKCVYRRHTNFSIFDVITVPKAKNSFGIDFQVELDKCGDMLHKVYLIVELPDLVFKNPIPSCDNVKKLLLEYGIIWNTDVIHDYGIVTSNCPSIITLQIYNETIIEVINRQIRKYIDMYNFYLCGKIFSTDSDYLKKSSQSVISRAFDDMFNYVLSITDKNNNDVIDFSVWGNIVKEFALNMVTNKLSNGVVASLMMLSRMLMRYSQEYLPVYASALLPSVLSNKYDIAVDGFGVKKNAILLYSNDFRNGYESKTKIFNVGVLLQLILNYYYDTFILNINPYSNKTNHGKTNMNFTSNPLFGEILNVPPNNLPNELVTFRLYNSQNIQQIYYMILMYNLTRLKIERTIGPYQYSLDHGTVYTGTILPPLNEPSLLGLKNPYVTFIDENVIFYHVIDPITTQYTVTNAQTKQNLSTYFNETIQTKYKLFDNYKEIFPFYNGVYFTETDSYKIHQKYMSSITTSNITRDSQQVTEIATLILYNIQYNMQYNMALLRNTTTVLNNGLFSNESHYRFSFYKKFKSTNNQFISTSSFQNNSNASLNTSSNASSSDNFQTPIISNMTITGPLNVEQIPTQTSGGTQITNFFSNDITNRINNFYTLCNAQLSKFDTTGYTTNYSIWKRGIFDIGNKIQETYTKYHTIQNPQYMVSNSFTENYKKNAIMNYIPFLVARDIPVMIYYVFSSSTGIKNALDNNAGGILSNFLETIDLRDSGDDGAPILSTQSLAVKTAIYQKMIQSVISPNTTLIDQQHFDSLVAASNSAQQYLITNTLRPEQLLSEYATEITNGIQDINTTVDPSYLPIEWLTQTYYNIYYSRIITFLFANSKSQYINEFSLLLKSIINCFIIYSTIPNQDVYVKNGYTMLQLVPETNLCTDSSYYSIPENDKISSVKFSDATSAIWYQLLKNYIKLYNSMLNDTILSKNYYKNNLGVTLDKMFDFFNYTANGDRSFTFYYEKENILDSTPITIGTIDQQNIQKAKTITIIINSNTFSNPDSSKTASITNNIFEERILLTFNSDTIAILKNQEITFDLRNPTNYTETIEIPSYATSCTITYINKSGYQIYLNIMVFLNTTNSYYNPNTNVYKEKILNTYQQSITNEPYPPITSTTTGFDFYRMRNLEIINKYTGKTKYVELQDFINDNITLFNYNLKYYTESSSILRLVNDTIIVYDDNGTITPRKTSDFFYEESDLICQYMNQHINAKYINQLPLTNNSNSINTSGTTTSTTTSTINNHQIFDIKPAFIGSYIPAITDIIGFAFQITDKLENDYSIGFGTALYPSSSQKIQIKKIGSNFYLYYNVPTETLIPIIINPTPSTIYYFFIDIQMTTINIYEINMPSITLIISQIIPIPIITPHLYISGPVQVSFLTLYDSFIQGIPFLNLLTQWFYIGSKDANPYEKYVPAIANIQQFLHTEFTTNTIAFPIDPLTTSITTTTSQDYPLGQLQQSPPLITSSDIIGFAFTVLNNAPTDFSIGLYGTSPTPEYILITNTNTIQYNNTTITTHPFTFPQDAIYYVILNQTLTTLTIHELNMTTNNHVQITIAIPSITFCKYNLSFYLKNNCYVRYYMDRKAYSLSASNATIQTVIQTVTKWYYIGGSYKEQYNPNITASNVQFTVKSDINSNIIGSISIGNYDYNDIAFPSGDNLLTYPILNIPILQQNNIIGYAFSITDGTADSFDIGLGTDGYFSSRGIFMSKTDISDFTISIYDNNKTIVASYPYVNNIRPLYGSTDIYFCFQNNALSTFTIYENKNPNPIFYIDNSDPFYNTLQQIFKNNANLSINGSCTVKYYTTNYAFIQASSTVQSIMSSVTDWYYIGATEIEPISDVSNISNRFHTNYLLNDIIVPLDNKLYFIDQVTSIDYLINPNSQKNNYNLNGVHGQTSDGTIVSYNTAIYGILDAIYNFRLTGNMDSTIKLINVDLPIGKINSDFITSDDNQFYSYCLRDLYNTLTQNSNYDNYLTDLPTTTQINNLTYSDLTDISTTFDKTIYDQKNKNVNHALININYIKEPTFINSRLFQIFPDTSSSAIINTTDQYEHIFSISSTIIDSPTILQSNSYGFSFTVGNITSTIIEIGVCFNNDINRKITIRKSDIIYDILIKNDVFEIKLIPSTIPNFNKNNLYTFIISNNDQRIIIYENFAIIFNEQITISDYSSLFTGNNTNLFVHGQVQLTYFSRTYAIDKSNTVLRGLISNPQCIWLSMNESINKFVSVTNYKFDFADTMFNDYSTITLNELTNGQSLDNIFSPNLIINNTDIIGFAFEVLIEPINGSYLGIGIGSGDIPNTSRLQIIKDIDFLYYIKIISSEGSISIPIPNYIEFKPNNIYMCIQNNIENTFTVYALNSNNQNNQIIIQLNTNTNPYYEKIVHSVFDTETNLLITASNSTQIKFYTAKYIFNISSPSIQIILNTSTKWMYVGALDTTPVSKVLMTMPHHKFEYGLTETTNAQINNKYLTHSDIVFNDKLPISNTNFVSINTNQNVKSINSFAFSVSNVSNSSTYNYTVGFANQSKTDFVAIVCDNNIYSIVTQSSSIPISLPSPPTITTTGYTTKASIIYMFLNTLTNVVQIYFNNILITEFNISPLSPLNTDCSLCASGNNNIIISFYSKSYIAEMGPISIKNIITDTSSPPIFWYGVTTTEDQNLFNTTDYRIVSSNNNTSVFAPSFQINSHETLNDDSVIISKYGILGFSFTIMDFNRPSSIRMGGVSIQMLSDSLIVLINGIAHSYISIPSFESDDIYYVFQNNVDNTFFIYENNKLIFEIDTSDSDYNALSNTFDDQLNIVISGQISIKFYNAPYAYLKTTPEIKILIDLCTIWLSFGGSNIGPLKNKLITSSKIYSDSNAKLLFSDPITGTLSNIQLVALYTYFEIITQSPLQKLFDISQFKTIPINYAKSIASVTQNAPQNANLFQDTLKILNEYMTSQVIESYNNITKITNLNTFTNTKKFTINGFPIFIDNSYKVYPNDYHYFNENGEEQTIYYDGYYRTGLFDYNFCVNFYMPSALGRPNGVIQTDLETRILKLIMNAAPSFAYARELGHKIINEVSVSIGDQQIDVHTSDLLHLIYRQLVSPEQQNGYDTMIGNTIDMHTYSPQKRNKKLYIPLRFWFCENIGNCLPMINLLHTTVTLNFKISKLNELLYYDPDATIYNNPKVTFSILSQYIYLDEEERLRISKIKMEYLIERYIYNGQSIISKNTSFESEVDYQVTQEDLIESSQPVQPTIYALKNLVYHLHDNNTNGSQSIIYLPNNGTIEPQRSYEINFREVITRQQSDYQLLPTFTFNQSSSSSSSSSSIIGFAFQLISTPETDPITGISPISPNTYLSPEGWIGLQINNSYILLKKTHITIIYIDPQSSQSPPQSININYDKQPSFRGGSKNTLIYDLYVCVQDYTKSTFTIYENSNPICTIDTSIIQYANMIQGTQKLNLFIHGTERIFIYNAKYPYNKSLRNLTQIFDIMTDWIYVGGDITPVTELYNHQYVHVIDTPAPILIGSDYSVIQGPIQITTQPSIDIVDDSLIAFSFSLQNTPNFSIGLTDGTTKIIFQKNIYGSILLNTVEYPLQKELAPQSTKILYTVFQDNITRIFTVYEENEIIGQVSNVLLSSPINAIIDFSSDVNFYTSNSVMSSHARLGLRRAINNVSDWISFSNYTPSFYIQSTRNITRKIINNISNNGIINAITTTSSDVTTENPITIPPFIPSKSKYILRPSQNLDNTQICGFSFSLINTPSFNNNFEIGISPMGSTRSYIVLKSNTPKASIEIYDGTTISSISLKNNQIISSNTSNAESPITVYTMIQDNSLGTFTLFSGDSIIAQINTTNKVYKNIFTNLQYGLSIIINGATTMRFYTSEYIYGVMKTTLKKYIERIDSWYFVTRDIATKTTTVAPYSPTTVSIRLRMHDPIKFFMWYMRAYDNTTELPMDILNWNRYGFTVRTKESDLMTIHKIISGLKIKMYGVDREVYRDETYYNSVQQYGRYVQSSHRGEYMYSFALYPMMLQPSGAANYSEIEDSVMQIQFMNDVETIMRNNPNIKIEFGLWGKSMNILRIGSGMGGLLFYK